MLRVRFRPGLNLIRPLVKLLWVVTCNRSDKIHPEWVYLGVKFKCNRQDNNIWGDFHIQKGTEQRNHHHVLIKNFMRNHAFKLMQKQISRVLQENQPQMKNINVIYLSILIFLYSVTTAFFDWRWVKSVLISCFSGPYLSVFSPNAGKYGPEKLRIRTFFKQCEELPLTHF